MIGSWRRRRLLCGVPVGLLIAAFAWTAWEEHVDSMIAEQVERTGASVNVSWRGTRPFLRPIFGRGDWPPRLRPIFGRRFVTVAIRKGADADAAIELATRLPQVDGLSIYDTNLSDDGWRRLPAFGQLMRLNIRKMPISDEALSYIGRLPRLNSLVVARTNITPEGIERLKRSLPKLQVVIADKLLDEQDAKLRERDANR